MSFNPRENHGYGINASRISTTSEKVLDFISLAPNFKDYFEEEIGQTVEDIKALNIDTRQLLELMKTTDFQCGIASVIAEVVHEKNDIALDACCEYDGDCYCLFSPKYLWDMTGAEIKLTQNTLERLFADCVAHLTNQSLDDLDYRYHRVQSGG